MKKEQDRTKAHLNNFPNPAIGEKLLNAGEGLAFLNGKYELQGFNVSFERLYVKITGQRLRRDQQITETVLFNLLPGGLKTLDKVFEGEYQELDTAFQSTASPLSVRLEPALDENEHVTGVFVHLFQAETDVVAAANRFKSVLESSGDAIILLSPEGKPTYASPSVEKVLGYSVEEVLDLDLYSVVHPDDLAGNQKVMEKAIFNPGIPIKGHVSRLLHKDGTYHWYDATLVNLLDDPAVGGLVDNIREVDGSTASGNRHAQMEELFGMVVDSARIRVWEIDRKSRLSVRNFRHDQIFGYKEPVPEWNTEFFFNHVHPEDRPAARRKFYESLQTGNIDLQTRIVWSDKTVHWIEVKGKVWKDEEGNEKMMGTVLDVSEIHYAREALIRSEERLKGIVEHLPDGLVIANRQGDILYWNPSALRIHGLDADKIGTKQLPEFLKYFKLYEENGRRIPFREWPLPRLQRGEPVNALKVHIKSLTKGWTKIFEYNGGTISDVYGQEVYFLTITDISGVTSRKTIKKSEEHFWEAFHLSDVALVISRKSDGICLDLNKSAESFLGYGYDEYMGERLLRLNFDSENDFETFFRAFNSNTGLFVEQETSIQAKTGGKKIKLFHVEQITLVEEACLLAILIDLP